jgi:hypothetical protein
MSANETIEQVAARMGVPVRFVQAMVTPLCREHGPQQVVAVALGMRDTVLTPFAVEQIEAAATAVQTAGAA